MTVISPEQTAEVIRERLGERVIDSSIAYGQLTVTVAAEAFADAARVCKETPELGFAFFDFLTAVDLGEDGFAVVAHLYSVASYQHVTLRTVVPGGRDNPKLVSLTDVYGGANWHERETYDMFGIDFEGHPGLLPRILTVENFEGWPLRKDFLLTTREIKPWPGLKEPGGVAEDGAGGGELPVVEMTSEDAEAKAQAAREKAERAKAKAAEMRALKAAERGAELNEGEEAPPADEADSAEAPAAAAESEEAPPADADSEGEQE